MTNYTNKTNQKYAIMKMTEPFEIMFKNYYICFDDNTGCDFVRFNRESADFRHILVSFMKQYFDDQSVDVDDALKVAFSTSDVHLNLVYRNEVDILTDTMQTVDLKSSQNFVYSNPVKDGLADLEILMLSKDNKKVLTKKSRKVVS